ncbi:sensor histidine kinase [Breznakiella homolactica]|uniref:histidine kinase n=1 Tax=Breznakiella homolactica TaxID=2798577 RepID=A0A7T7XQW5_9SPIR|nr:sensor histidine kinase [Breznakiella homolactica]QQO10825.1 histidine kinase [Breznakiella homolactica]
MKIKMQHKMNLYFLILIILPIGLLSIMLFDYYVKILEEKINGMTKQVLAQTAGSIKIIMDNAVMASNILCVDSQFADSLFNAVNQENRWEQYTNAMYVHNQIKDIQNAVLFNYNEAKIFVIDTEGTVYSDMSIANTPGEYETIQRSPWYRKTVEKNGFIHWTSLDQSENIFQNKEAVAISQLIKGNKTSRNFGVVLILFPKSTFNRILSKEDENREDKTITVLMDSNYSVLAYQSESYEKETVMGMNYPSLINHEKAGHIVSGGALGELFVNYEEIPGTGMTLVNIINYDAMMSEVYALRNNTYLVSIIIFILMIFLAVYLSWNVTSPVKKLEKAMMRIQGSDFSARVAIGGCLEIESLGKSFNMMAGQMDTLIHQVAEETRLRQEARLEALQAQINPHFLINTLNSIRWMAAISGNENVSDMISNLGLILEGSIYNSQEEIPLREELRCLYSYIELQKMRFGNQFELVTELPDALLDCRLPRFILQPIVENSILHGIASSMSGIITITGKIDGPVVSLEVRDNGVGIPPEKIAGILSGEHERKGKLSNIGLSNVQQRIKLNYGEAYGLVITSENSGGTSVIITLPLSPEADL